MENLIYTFTGMITGMIIGLLFSWLQGIITDWLMSKGSVCGSHYELIKCPDCEIILKAEIEHTMPFPTYVHECWRCGYIIMESEWNPVKPISHTVTPDGPKLTFNEWAVYIHNQVSILNTNYSILPK